MIEKKAYSLKIDNPISKTTIGVEATFIGIGILNNEVGVIVVLALNKDVIINGQRLKRGEVLIPDPRAMIMDMETGIIVYNPRDYLDLLGSEMLKWILLHPEWPPQPRIDKMFI